MSKSLPLLLVVALLALTGCEKEALVVAEPGLAKAGNERAFRGELVSTPLQFDFGTSCSLGPFGPGFPLRADHAGNLTHLGKTTGSYAGCARPYLPNVPASIPGVFALDFTALGAHGDELHFSIRIFSAPNPDDPGLADISGTYHINGGTGRFASATGIGDVTGFAPAALGSADVPPTLQFSGTIVY